MERLAVQKYGTLFMKYADCEYRSPCFGCESINRCNPEKMPCSSYKALKKLAEYEDLEEQGKLLKLLCVVGGEVWYISEKTEKQGRKKITVSFVDRGIIDHITLGCLMIPQITVCNDENIWTTFDSVEDFEKTFFLTQEEAEAALKEL